jgi:anti-sigma regulatory factor (Ser/Thr protein kinase)
MKRESWLPAAPESASIARAIVRDVACREGLDGNAVWDLMLATSEAVANAVVHGRACREGIRLTVHGRRNGVCVEVLDCGGFHGNGNAGPAATDAVVGRGIPLMTAVTDHFELMPGEGGTRVRFGKRRARVAA